MGDKIYVIYEDSDKTEGRGTRYAVGYTNSSRAALRAAKGLGVQGTVGFINTVEVGSSIPVSSLRYFKPSSDDLMLDDAQEKRTAAVEKALAAGLTEDDIAALIFRE